MVLDNSLLQALIPTLPGPRPSRMVTKAADNGVDCTPDTNVSRTAPAPFTWPPVGSPSENSPTPPTRQGRCEHGDLRLVHLWEPGALLQPWQHCPPQTLTLKQSKTPESGGCSTLFQRTQPSRGFPQAQHPASIFLWLPESPHGCPGCPTQRCPVRRVRT